MTGLVLAGLAVGLLPPEPAHLEPVVLLPQVRAQPDSRMLARVLAPVEVQRE